MIPSNRTATHPGEVLRDEFLAELGIPQTELAAKLEIPVQRINEIVNGKRGQERALCRAGNNLQLLPRFRDRRHDVEELLDERIHLLPEKIPPLLGKFYLCIFLDELHPRGVYLLHGSSLSVCRVILPDVVEFYPF